MSIHKQGNFVERTVELCLKLLKNEKAADVLDADEAPCVVQALDLLVECIEGPCPRNQEPPWGTPHNEFCVNSEKNDSDF